MVGRVGVSFFFVLSGFVLTWSGSTVGGTWRFLWNRLARIYAAGRGLDKNPLQAARWHILARAKGVTDSWLDTVVNQLSGPDRVKVDLSLRKMLGR